MVEHMLQMVYESLVQGYCATADCVTGDCVRLRDKRYYCTPGKKKNTTNYARNKQPHCYAPCLSPSGLPDFRQLRLRTPFP